MHIFKLKAFTRFQRRGALADEALIAAVDRAERGLIDADLGGGLIKQRVARRGQGRSGGFRTILAYRRGARAVFLYGFSKSDRDNIDDVELDYWRRIGQAYLNREQTFIATAITAGEISEVANDGTESG
jgi:hypothetical protein